MERRKGSKKRVTARSQSWNPQVGYQWQRHSWNPHQQLQQPMLLQALLTMRGMAHYDHIGTTKFRSNHIS